MKVEEGKEVRKNRNVCSRSSLPIPRGENNFEYSVKNQQSYCDLTTEPSKC